MINTFFLLFLSFFSLLFSSCAIGPKQEKKSALNYLNGEHYESVVSGGGGVGVGAPFVIQRKIKHTVIKGEVHFVQKDDDFEYPLKYAKVSLFKEKQLLHSTQTNHKGEFTLSKNIADGHYFLKVEKKRFPLVVKGYLLEGIKLTIQR